MWISHDSADRMRLLVYVRTAPESRCKNDPAERAAICRDVPQATKRIAAKYIAIHPLAFSASQVLIKD